MLGTRSFGEERTQSELSALRQQSTGSFLMAIPGFVSTRHSAGPRYSVYGTVSSLPAHFYRKVLWTFQYPYYCVFSEEI